MKANELRQKNQAELDKEIPSALYAAVAEVLAYVFQLNNWRRIGGTYPTPPRSISPSVVSRPRASTFPAWISSATTAVISRS